MVIAVTGGTGFLGRTIINRLTSQGHHVRAWNRPTSQRNGFANPNRITWVPGALRDADAGRALVDGSDALVHAAFWRPGTGFRGAEGDLTTFVDINLLGSLQLFEAAHEQSLRIIFISTCAVHEVILDDRPLDETHPTWPKTHYGAHKAAVEQFVASFGYGDGRPICSLRPCGIYGIAEPITASPWFDLVQAVVRGEPVACKGGGKIVHATDVAAAVETLLQVDATKIAGQVFNCCERYVSEWEIAQTVQRLTSTDAPIAGGPKTPKHQIESGKLKQLGFEFGGQPLFEETLSQLANAVCRE